jgi:hypothetical protein
MPTISLKDALKNGLSKGFKQPKSELSLDKALNMVVGASSTYPFQPYVEYTPSNGWAFPIPQFFEGHEAYYLFYADEIFVCPRDFSTETELDYVDYYSREATTLAADGGPWTFARTHTGFVACNATNFVIYTVADDEVLVCPLLAKVCCVFRNRLMLGNLDTVLQEFTALGISSNQVDSFGEGVGPRSVYWTKPSMEDLQFMLDFYKYAVNDPSDFGTSVELGVRDSLFWTLDATFALTGGLPATALTGTDAAIADEAIVILAKEATADYNFISPNTKVTFKATFTEGSLNVKFFHGTTELEFMGQEDISQNRTYYYLVSVPEDTTEDFTCVFTATAEFSGTISLITVAQSSCSITRNNWLEGAAVLDFGFYPNLCADAVTALKPLGDGVAAYGANNCWYLFPISEPFVGFGKTRIIDVGPMSSLTLCGPKDFHHFVDSSGMVHELKANLEHREVGYSELFSAYVDGQLKAIYDPIRKLTILSVGVGGSVIPYVLEAGMSYVGQQIYDVVGFVDGDRLCIGAGSFTSTNVLIRTTAMDFDVEGLKTLVSVCVAFGNVGDNKTVTLKARLYYRTSPASAFRVSETVTLDARGEAVFGITGVDFMVEVFSDASTYVNFRIEDINVTYDVAVTNVRALTRRR